MIVIRSFPPSTTPSRSGLLTLSRIEPRPQLRVPRTRIATPADGSKCARRASVLPQWWREKGKGGRTRSAAIALTIEAKSTRRTCSKPPLLCEPTSCNVIIHTPAYGMTKPLFTYHKCSTRPAVLLGITRGPVVFRRHGFLFSIFCLEVLPGTHHRPQAFSAFTTYE